MIPELSVVALTRDLHVGRLRIKEDTTGTVVHVWNEGVAYEVEFDRSEGKSESRDHYVLTAKPDDLRVVWIPEK